MTQTRYPHARVPSSPLSRRDAASPSQPQTVTGNGPLHQLLWLPRLSYIEELLQGRRVLLLGLSSPIPFQALRGADEVVALDPSPVRIRYTQNRSQAQNVSFRMTELLESGLPGGSFDVILAYDQAISREFCTEVRRLLSSDGFLFLVEPGPARPQLGLRPPVPMPDPVETRSQLRRYFAHAEQLVQQHSLSATLSPRPDQVPSWRMPLPQAGPQISDYIYLCSQLPIQLEERLIVSWPLSTVLDPLHAQRQRLQYQLIQREVQIDTLEQQQQALQHQLQTQEARLGQLEAGLPPTEERISEADLALLHQTLQDSHQALQLARTEAQDLQIALEEAEGALEQSERLRAHHQEQLLQATQLLDQHIQQQHQLMSRMETLEQELGHGDTLSRPLAVLPGGRSPQPTNASDTGTFALPTMGDREHYEKLLTREQLRNWMLEERVSRLVRLLEDAGLPVPPELIQDELFETPETTAADEQLPEFAAAAARLATAGEYPGSLSARSESSAPVSSAPLNPPAGAAPTGQPHRGETAQTSSATRSAWARGEQALEPSPSSRPGERTETGPARANVTRPLTTAPIQIAGGLHPDQLTLGDEALEDLAVLNTLRTTTAELRLPPRSPTGARPSGPSGQTPAAQETPAPSAPAAPAPRANPSPGVTPAPSPADSFTATATAPEASGTSRPPSGPTSERQLFEEEQTDELAAWLAVPGSKPPADKPAATGPRTEDWISDLFEQTIPPDMAGESPAAEPAAVTPAAPTPERAAMPAPAPVAEQAAAMPAAPATPVSAHFPAPTPAASGRSAVPEVSAPRLELAPAPPLAAPLVAPLLAPLVAPLVTPLAASLSDDTGLEAPAIVETPNTDTHFPDGLDDVEMDSLPPVRRRDGAFSSPFRALDNTIETRVEDEPSEELPPYARGMRTGTSNGSDGEALRLPPVDSGLTGESQSELSLGGATREAGEGTAAGLPPFRRPDPAIQRALLDDWDHPPPVDEAGEAQLRRMNGLPPVPPAPGDTRDAQFPTRSDAPPTTGSSTAGGAANILRRKPEPAASGERPVEAQRPVPLPSLPREERSTTPLMPGKVTWPASLGNHAHELDLPQRGEMALLEALARSNVSNLPSVTQQEDDDLEKVLFDAPLSQAGLSASATTGAASVSATTGSPSGPSSLNHGHGLAQATGSLAGPALGAAVAATSSSAGPGHQTLSTIRDVSELPGGAHAPASSHAPERRRKIRPVSERPASERPTLDRPLPELSAAERSTLDRPFADRPLRGQTGVPDPLAIRPGERPDADFEADFQSGFQTGIQTGFQNDPSHGPGEDDLGTPSQPFMRRFLNRWWKSGG